MDDVDKFEQWELVLGVLTWLESGLYIRIMS
jgi:hypothetical protein